MPVPSTQLNQPPSSYSAKVNFTWHLAHIQQLYHLIFIVDYQNDLIALNSGTTLRITTSNDPTTLSHCLYYWCVVWLKDHCYKEIPILVLLLITSKSKTGNLESTCIREQESFREPLVIMATPTSASSLPHAPTPPHVPTPRAPCSHHSPCHHPSPCSIHKIYNTQNTHHTRPIYFWSSEIYKPMTQNTY